ncbi:MAG: hypothetical protein PCFJNLEI_01523 [Verrucomicrobiae bacterium]|nr:hypothetical protein [Verrucomicrobiae bacterium]
MEQYIRIGLLAVWVLFALAALVWWRRRHSSKKYSYTERAQVILDAIHAGVDVGMIYWSKSEKKFIRRVVTPEELDGYSMRAFDHTLGGIRIFKVTRIRLIEPIPKGAPKRAPSRLKLVSVPTVAAITLGGIALGLLALTLNRGTGPQPMAASLPLPAIRAPGVPVPVEPPPAPAPTNAALALPVKLAPKEVDPDDFLNAPPEPVQPKEKWYLILENHAKYKPGQVANQLQAILRYRPERAVELEQSVVNLGRAVVWSGSKARAEMLQQLMAGYDLAAVIERADGETNAVVQGSNSTR